MADIIIVGNAIQHAQPARMMGIPIVKVAKVGIILLLLPLVLQVV